MDKSFIDSVVAARQQVSPDLLPATSSQPVVAIDVDGVSTGSCNGRIL